MVSAQILQRVVDGLKEITRFDISVIETEGKIIASTEEGMAGQVVESLRVFMVSAAEVQILEGYSYFKVFDNNVAEYVVSVKGNDGESHTTGQIASFQIQCILGAYKERYDKDNFIKNLLLDNFLLVDIYSRAKKMRIDIGATRIVFLIEAGNRDFSLIDRLRETYESPRDFITAVDEKHIIIVKQLNGGGSEQEIKDVFDNLNEVTNEHLGEQVRISTGTKVTDLKNVSLSYKEAKMALEVSSIFETEKFNISYETLGVGRIIYQLPVSLCKIFMNEILGDGSIETFEEEILVTVDKFFENNLNVSETARQLFIHRNTLVYRLNKIQKITNLDLNNFEDAVVFKIILMVSKYVSYKTSNQN